MLFHCYNIPNIQSITATYVNYIMHCTDQMSTHHCIFHLYFLCNKFQTVNEVKSLEVSSYFYINISQTDNKLK
jgi:hypothetical protein